MNFANVILQLTKTFEKCCSSFVVEHIPPKLYHVTNTSSVDAILTDGLRPGTGRESHNFRYTPRIYLSPSPNLGLGMDLGFHPDESLSVLEINTASVPGLSLTIDSQFDYEKTEEKEEWSSAYTTSAIPPDAISIFYQQPGKKIFRENSLYMCDSDKNDYIARFIFDTYTAAEQRSKSLDNDLILAVEFIGSTKKVYDTRNPEHLKLFGRIIETSRKLDDHDDWLRKSDLVSMKSEKGEEIGTLPAYHTAYTLKEILEPEGFQGAIVGNGIVSMVVFNPQLIHVVDTIF